MPYSPPRPRWDIVEEHLHEAEFLWGLWEHGLRAPDFTPLEVARGPEARLTAHLDALVLSGPEVAPRLLIPALAADEPQLVSAAAAALLKSPAGLDAVLAALRDRPDQRAALVRALGCAERLDLPRIRALFVEPGRLASAAAVLHAHGEPLGPILATLRASDAPGERSLGLYAIADEPDPAPHFEDLQRALAQPDPTTVDAALLAGVRLGLAPAWSVARTRAGQQDGAAALLLLALGHEDPTPLIAALARRRRRPAALWALGFLGTPEAVDAALEFLDDEAVGHLAGEVFTAISGVDLVQAGMALPRSDRNALAHSPEHSLPRPEPMAVLRWWTHHRGEFIDGARYLAGAPRTRAGLHAALSAGPMRRRPAWLLDMQLHTPIAHRPRLEAFAPIARQRRQLAAMADLAALPLTRI